MPPTRERRHHSGVGQIAGAIPPRHTAPFNGAVEIGLRALCILSAAFSDCYSLQRLTILDYLVVHSDDLPDGPRGLHPQTPNRGGEILVRRDALQRGLLLYESRGLVARRFEPDGVFYAATDHSAAFLDALDTYYVEDLRDRATWIVEGPGRLDDTSLDELVKDHIGEWGAEFALQSVLRTEEFG